MNRFQLKCLTALIIFCIFSSITSAGEFGIIALSNDDVGLSFIGSPELAIEGGGGIYVNSTLENGFSTLGTPFRSGESLLSEINVVGGYDIPANVLEYLQTTNNGAPTILRTGVDPIADPLGFVPEPSLLSISPMAPIDGSTLSISGGTHVLAPGYYPGGIDIFGGDVTFSPGIYQIGGDVYNHGLQILGGNVYADQVMFHVLDGSFDVVSAGSFSLTPPSDGIYGGISIFQSRTNYNDSEIGGIGQWDLTGSLYFPNNHLSLTPSEEDIIGSQIIADTIEIAGLGLIRIVPEPCTLLLLGVGGLLIKKRKL